jgi:hypothetical protein
VLVDTISSGFRTSPAAPAAAIPRAEQRSGNLVSSLHASDRAARKVEPPPFELERADGCEMTVGADLQEVVVIDGRLCGEGNGLVLASTDMVVAESLAAAQDALPCSSEEVIELETDPPLDNGCSFYACRFAQAF